MTSARAVNYLDGALASLKAAGFNPAIVHDLNGDGSNATYRAALSFLLGNTKSDRLVVFQDDVVVARGLSDWIEHNTAIDTMGNGSVASLYCAAAYGFQVGGWNELSLQQQTIDLTPWTRVYGALAMVWPWDVAQQFLNDPPSMDGRTMTDQQIGRWLSDNGKTLLIHSPSLVQHVGKVSCFGHNVMNEYRMASDFVDDVAKLGAA